MQATYECVTSPLLVCSTPFMPHRAFLPSPPPMVQIMQQRLPAATLANLFPFQRDGVRFIVRSKGRALLADEPGLGKTVQVGTGEGRGREEKQAGPGCAYQRPL